MSRATSIAPLLVFMFCASCGTSGEPVNQESLDECIVDVWFHSPRDCSCTVSVLDTPECAQPDCQAADMILLSSDQRYFSSVLRWSEGLRTLSAPGGRVLLTADWGVELPDVLVLDRDSGVTTTRQIACSSGHMTLDDIPFLPAPADLRAGALSASRADTWLSMPY